MKVTVLQADNYIIVNGSKVHVRGPISDCDLVKETDTEATVLCEVDWWTDNTHTSVMRHNNIELIIPIQYLSRNANVLNYCRTCEIDFASLTAFDAHLKGIKSLKHLSPEKVGLERRDNGRWGFPFEEDTFDFVADDSPTPVKIYQCPDCKGFFCGTGKRGRPPRTCARTSCGGKGVPCDENGNEE